MFTGIIQTTGLIQDIVHKNTDAKFAITTGNMDMSYAQIGDSIAVNGVCLTAVSLNKQSFTADVSAETLSKTTLKYAKIGDMVNLEQALTLNTHLGGHLVNGHIDGIASIDSKKQSGDSIIFGIRAPNILSKYIATKGSVCLDGVSLTVNAINGTQFFVNIVPHTSQKTTFGTYQVGNQINLEIDLIARYLERLMQSDDVAKNNPITQDFLQTHGYL